MSSPDNKVSDNQDKQDKTNSPQNDFNSQIQQLEQQNSLLKIWIDVQNKLDSQYYSAEEAFDALDQDKANVIPADKFKELLPQEQDKLFELINKSKNSNGITRNDFHYAWVQLVMQYDENEHKLMILNQKQTFKANMEEQTSSKVNYSLDDMSQMIDSFQSNLRIEEMKKKQSFPNNNSDSKPVFSPIKIESLYVSQQFRTSNNYDLGSSYLRNSPSQVISLKQTPYQRIDSLMKLSTPTKSNSQLANKKKQDFDLFFSQLGFGSYSNLTSPKQAIPSKGFGHSQIGLNPKDKNVVEERFNLKTYIRGEKPLVLGSPKTNIKWEDLQSCKTFGAMNFKKVKEQREQRNQLYSPINNEGCVMNKFALNTYHMGLKHGKK